MNQKLRIQREVGERVVRLLGLRDSEIGFVDEHPDAGGPDAVIMFNGAQKIVEMTRADPEASGALLAPALEKGYLSGSVRGPLHKLWNSFRALDADMRRFDVFVNFHNDRVPQGHRSAAFLAELCDVMRLVQADAYECSNHHWRRDRWVVRPPFGGRKTLVEYCSRIELDPDVTPHGGQIGTSHDSYWGVKANISEIVERKAQKPSQAHWLVIFEWEIWGSVPDLSDLEPLRSNKGFERVFILRPIWPAQLIEWDESKSKWLVVGSDLAA